MMNLMRRIFVVKMWLEFIFLEIKNVKKVRFFWEESHNSSAHK